MEHLWSPAGATGGNRRQMGPARKPLKQSDPQPLATHANRFGAHGKEGVDGSSPSEGLQNPPLTGIFRSGRLADRATCGGYGAVYGAFAHAKSTSSAPERGHLPCSARELEPCEPGGRQALTATLTHLSRFMSQRGDVGVPGWTRPLSYASTTAWARSCRSSLAKMRATCVLTVASPTKSSRAISPLEKPRATS